MDENMDFSKALEKVQDMLSREDGQNVIENLISAFTSDHSDSDNTSCKETSAIMPDNSASNFNFDLDMFIKLQKILNATQNQSNKKAQFLHSLKPFLKPSRRTRLDHAVKLMNTLSVLKALKNTDEGGN